tara:strand:- start:1343 stop:1555 length:213 start_codon:yes stop_codon:yes gene_type:complete
MKTTETKDSKTKFTKLESVGSAISNFGFIYPLNADGSVDAACQIDVADASDEWLESLSKGDKAIVKKATA